MKKRRLLTLLALLMTAATGAWAGWTGGTYTATATENLGAITVSSDATLTINSNVTVTVTGGINVASGTLTVTGPGTLVVTGGNGGNGSYGEIDGGNGGNGGVAISGNIIVQGGAVVTATGGNGGNGGRGDAGKGGRGGNGGNAFAGTLTYKDGTVTANGGSGGSGGWGDLDQYYASSGSAGKAFADANSVSFQTDYILTSNGSAIQTIGGQQQITIAPPPVAVTGVTLPATATVTLGDPVALTAAVAPADATDKKVKWSVTSGSDKVKLYKDAECKTEVGTDATDVLTVYAKGLAAGDATVKVESNADATKSATCAVTAKHGTYKVSMKAGVTDGDQWTAKAGQDGQYQALPLKGVEGGTKPVELKYAGDREVKRVTATVTPKWKGDLSKILGPDVESDGVTMMIADGMTLTGTLTGNYKLVIADGATVTLDGVTVSGVNDANCQWAGITCLGDATIVLKDGSVNAVTGFQENYPGIYVPEGSTLTIEGPGKLTASSNGKGAGIGGGKNLGCGNIVIAATVGYVKAMKGTDAPYSIGAGDESTCGTVTIGGTVYYDGSDYQNDGATYLAQATIEYPTPAYTLLSAATTEDVGKVVCAAGHLHDAKTAVPTGCTAVGIVGKVTATGHGLILALQDATTQAWDNINGWTSVYSYAGTTLKVLPDDAARGTNLTSYTTLGETTVSNWAVGQKSDYDAIFQNLGSTAGDVNGKSYDGHVNAYITTGVGGTNMSGYYWSATRVDGSCAWSFDNGYWDDYKSTYNSCRVRPVLGFGEEALPALNITSPSVGQVIGRDGKNYAYGSLPTGVTAWAKICYVSGSNGLALALTDEGQMDWSTAQTTCAAHTAPFTGGTWKLATKDEWDNMISAAGSYTALRDGFSSVGGTDMLWADYWSSTEYDSDSAWSYRFDYGDWKYNSKNSTFGYLARACLEF